MALVGEIEQTTGSTDDDVDTLLQFVDLLLVGAPTVDRQDLEARLAAAGQVLGSVHEVVGDLDAQLAGRDDHECTGSAVEGGRAGALGGDAVQKRNAEAERLAHTRTGLTDEVVAGEGQRQGEFLDREGAFDADLGEGADDLVADTEFAEGGGYVGGVELCGDGRFARVVFVVDGDLAQGSGLPGLGTHARGGKATGLHLSASGFHQARRSAAAIRSSGARTLSGKLAGHGRRLEARASRSIVPVPAHSTR